MRRRVRKRALPAARRGFLRIIGKVFAEPQTLDSRKKCAFMTDEIVFENVKLTSENSQFLLEKLGLFSPLIGKRESSETRVEQRLVKCGLSRV